MNIVYGCRNCSCVADVSEANVFCRTQMLQRREKLATVNVQLLRTVLLSLPANWSQTR